MGAPDPLINFISQLVGFGLYLINFAFSLFGFVWSIVGSIPFLITVLTVSTIVIPYVRYQPEIVNNWEHFERTVVWPFYRDTARPILNAIREFFNPTICVVDAYVYWSYGLVWDVIWPTAVDCDVFGTANALGKFIVTLLQDFFLDYFLQLKFFDGPFNYNRTCASWVVFFTSFEDTYCCGCNDLCQFIKYTPFPFSPISSQLSDPETCIAVGEFVNAFMEFLNVVLTLVWEIVSSFVNWSLNIQRPDMYQVQLLLCSSLDHVSISYGNIMQIFWDTFVPAYYIRFQDGYFSMFTTALKLILKTINWVYTLAINFDQVIDYPANPFYITTMKDLTIESVNLFSSPTRFARFNVAPTVISTGFNVTNYWVSSNATQSPTGFPNANYHALRMNTAVCIFINRTMCNPNDPLTECYGLFFSDFLKDINPCCLTDTVAITVVDLLTGLFEMTLHFDSFAHFFTYMDQQTFSASLRDDLINVSSCLINAISLIPQFGYALQNLITRTVQYLLAMADHGIHMITGLLTLPYFLIALPGTDNYVTNYTESITQFVQIQQTLIEATPTSFLNSLKALLNNALPIPPIPCSDCIVGGYIVVNGTFSVPIQQNPNRKYRTLQELFDMNPVGDASHLVTPLINYNREFPTNPWDAAKMIYLNSQDIGNDKGLPFPTHKDINAYVDRRKGELAERWNRIRKCEQDLSQEAHLKKIAPRYWLEKKRKGDYDCNRRESRYIKPSSSRKEGVYVMDEESGNYTLHEREPRFYYATFTPYPEPGTIFKCSNPTPPCFDASCLPAAALEAAVQGLIFFANMVNGAIQYNPLYQLPIPTPTTAPYYTGDLCKAPWNQACFQNDFILTTQKILRIAYCLCDALNLLVPVLERGRPDICKAISDLSNVLVSISQVLVNSIMSLVLGGEETPVTYSYFRLQLFTQDIDVLFDYILDAILSLVNLIRVTFPLNYIPGFTEATNFDIGCLPQSLLDALTEITRFVVLTVVSLATITITPPAGSDVTPAVCWFRVDTQLGCGPTINDTGIIRQFDVVLNTIFPGTGDPDCAKNCLNMGDQGSGGATTCICQLINTLVPFRDNPSKPVNCTIVNYPGAEQNLNCMFIDLCCPIVKLGQFTNNFLKWAARALASMWQPWYDGFPQFFVEYFFCSELSEPITQADWDANLNRNCDACTYAQQIAPQTAKCDLGNGTVIDCGTFICGVTKTWINDLFDPRYGLLSCTCTFISILDRLLVWFFSLVTSTWANCFCGNEYPLVRSLIAVLQEVVNTLMDSIRKSPLACYWKPFPSQFSYNTTTGQCQPAAGVPQLFDVTTSVIYRLLNPIANALCHAVGNVMCIVNSILFLPVECIEPGKRLVGGAVQWPTYVLEVFGAFVEGFVVQFTNQQPTCIGVGSDGLCQSNSGQLPNVGEYGLNTIALARILTPMLSLPFDLVMADAQIGCTSICPKGSSNPNLAPRLITNPCLCYDVSHATRGRYNVAWDPFAPNATAPPLNQKSVWSPLQLFDSNGTVVNQTALDLAIAQMNNTLNDPYALYYPLYVRYMDKPDYWFAKKDTVPVFENVCVVTTTPIPTESNSNYFTEFPDRWVPGIMLPPCIGVDDWSFFVQDGSPVNTDPRAYSTCNQNGFCRPDNLPTCGVSNAAMTPDEMAYGGGIIRALDGVLMSFIRWIGCAASVIPGSEYLIYPFEILDSIIWQIISGFIDLTVAMLLFLLSVILSGSTDGRNCDCYEYTDTMQIVEETNFTLPNGGSYLYENKGNIDFALFDDVVDYCYSCPLGDTENCNCVINPTTPETDHFTKCAAHCPINTGTVANCVAALNLLTRNGENTALVQAIMPVLINLNYTHVCSGTNSGGGIVPPNDFFIPLIPPTINFGFCGTGTFNAPAFCPAPYCQWNGENSPPIPGKTLPGYWHRCSFSKCCGCTRLGGEEFLQCGSLGLVVQFFDLLNIFVSIFTRKYYVPDGQSDWVPITKRNELIDWSTRREGRVKMSCRTGIINKSPQKKPVDNIFSIFYDYDTSDCIDDPVSCVCRNFDVPRLCTWNSKKQYVVSPKTIYPNEVLSVVGDKFQDGNSYCDKLMRHYATLDWDKNMTYKDKIEWSDCLDQRIQGERISSIYPSILPANIIYSRNAPYTILNNILNGYDAYVNKQHKKTVESRTKRSMKRDVDPFPGFDIELRERTIRMRAELQKKMGVDSPLLNSLVTFDVWWYKYQKGYYTHLYNKMWTRMTDESFMLPSVKEASDHLSNVVQEYKRTLSRLPIRKLFGATGSGIYAAADLGNQVWKRGVVRFARDGISLFASKHEARREKLNNQTRAMIQASPITRWWNGEFKSNIGTFAPFMEHMSKVIHRARTNPNAPMSLWNVESHLGGVKKHFRQLAEPRWTPRKRANFHSLQRIGYRFYNIAFPGALTKRQRERFLFGNTCIILQRAEVLANNLIGFCVADLSNNLNFTNPVTRYAQSVNSKNRYLFYNKQNMGKYDLIKPVDPRGWTRPVFNYTRNPYKWRIEPHHSLDQRVFRRATRDNDPPPLGPAGWNFIDWIIDVINNFVVGVWGINESTWLDAVRDWLLNPNLAEADYPNVGARYWSLFFVRCRWPDNVNCSKGIGILNAFWWVTLAFVIVAFIATRVLPQFLWIFSFYPLFFSYLIMLGVVGLHYSPACLGLWPTINDYDGISISGSYGFGRAVVLPMCLMDGILNVTDTYITGCLSPQFIPTYMINGDPCPSDPNQYIDFISCQIVGVSDGIQNILFFCYEFLGTWALDLINALVNSTIGLFVPGVNGYFSATVDSFRTANPTQQNRQWFCFWATFPAIFIPVAFLFIGGVFIGFVIPFLILLLFQIWELIQSTPLTDSVDDYDDIENIPDFKVQEVTAKNVAMWIRYYNK